jgi:hypothetical protein
VLHRFPIEWRSLQLLWINVLKHASLTLPLADELYLELCDAHITADYITAIGMNPIEIDQNTTAARRTELVRHPLLAELV